ncbi:MAG TPA: SPOR domain-containing protein [Lutibacter sp.]|nr:SPOR domain-containing protein [Lutibacter sp.]
MVPEITRLEPLHEEVDFDLITGDISDKEVYLNTEQRRRKLAPFFSYAALFAVLFVVGYFLTQVIIKQNKDLNEVAKLEADHEALMNKRIQEATFEINKTLPAITLRMNVDDELQDNVVTDNQKQDATLQDVKEQNEVSNSNQFNETETSIVEEEKTEIEDKENALSTITVEHPKENKATTIDNSQNTNNSETLDYKYHIIAGAFRGSANADKKVNQLKDKGYNASIVGVNKWKLTQVAFNSFATREEAQVFLRKIKNTEAKDAWMLVK